jgi:hypothetical protein
MLYTLPWARFELTASVVIGTDCIGSCKSNYSTIMATSAPDDTWGLNNTHCHRISTFQFFSTILQLYRSSWIYNYLCNQCLSPLMLWVQISLKARCTTCDKICPQTFNSSFRYKDDVMSLNNSWFCDYLHIIYPIKLEVNDTTDSATNKVDCYDISEILLNVV